MIFPAFKEPSLVDLTLSSSEMSLINSEMSMHRDVPVADYIPLIIYQIIYHFKQYQQ